MLSEKTRRGLIVFLATISTTGLIASGCGESAPPPTTPASIEEAQKEANQIIMKEHQKAAPRYFAPKKDASKTGTAEKK